MPRAKKHTREGRSSFTVKIYPGEDGYFVAYCEELPGCVSQGKTLREARENIREAMILYLETLSEMAVRPRRRAPAPRARGRVRVARFSLEPVGA